MAPDTATGPRPHYVTTPGGQVRLWLAGQGATLIALPGLIRSAETVARELARTFPGWRVVAVELPGIGYSAGAGIAGIKDMAARIADALSWLGDAPCALLAHDLAAPLAEALCARAGEGEGGPNVVAAFTLGRDTALGWKSAGIAPPDIAPRQDGTHLPALWAFLRDRHLLVPDDPGLPLAEGPPVPPVDELSATFVSAARDPGGFATGWQLCIAALSPGGAQVQVAQDLTGVGDLPGALPDLPDCRAAPPPTHPMPGRAPWNDYAETARGRLHLRRAGAQGTPLLVIPSGGGSSEQFAPVVAGLADGRRVFAVDYPGNGLSDPPRGPVSIASLARDMVALLDAMEIETTDIWGSHTGALVALEIALIAPGRVGRLVMEGPVFIDPGFQDDILSNYFIDFSPDIWGRHLLSVWNWRRDMFMYWPWYRVERAAARQLGVPGAGQIHMYALGILESGDTYDRAYRSAFSYDTHARLPGLTRPALVCAGPNDQLKNAVEEAPRTGPADLVSAVETPTTVWWPDPDPAEAEETLAIYDRFLHGARG